MSSGVGSLHKVLKDKTRREIILVLQEKGSLSYVDLMKALEIDNTGKMNYHLKILGDLLSKNEAGQYTLTENGDLAARMLQEFPEVSKTMEKEKSALGLASLMIVHYVWGLLSFSAVIKNDSFLFILAFFVAAIPIPLIAYFALQAFNIPAYLKFVLYPFVVLSPVVSLLLLQ